MVAVPWPLFGMQRVDGIALVHCQSGRPVGGGRGVHGAHALSAAAVVVFWSAAAADGHENAPWPRLADASDRLLQLRAAPSGGQVGTFVADCGSSRTVSSVDFIDHAPSSTGLECARGRGTSCAETACQGCPARIGGTRP